MCSVAQYLISVYLMLNIQLDYNRNLRKTYSKAYKVQIVEITKLLTVFVCFGRHT